MGTPAQSACSRISSTLCRACLGVLTGHGVRHGPMMNQAALSYVISATVGRRVRAYRAQTCRRRSRKPTLRLIPIRSICGSGHFGGFDAKIILAGCDSSAGASHANTARAGADRAGCRRHRDDRCARGDSARGDNDNAERNHRHFQPALRLQEERIEEAGEEKDDAAAGDRSFGRQRHRSRALSQLRAEAVPAIRSVREAVTRAAAWRDEASRRRACESGHTSPVAVCASGARVAEARGE